VEAGPVWRLAQAFPEVQTEHEEATTTPASPAAPVEAAKGTLVIDAGPAGCEVWIDGAGRTVRGMQAIAMPVGPHSVACRKAGRLDGRRVVVAAGKTAFVRFR
jgi:hypothetical protein